MDWFQQIIKRPVAVSMVFCSLILLGAISLFQLPVDLLPETSYPVLSVTTNLGGYSPKEIEQTLTKPMETALSSLNNLIRLKSVSQEGKSDLQLEFKLGTNMDFVIQEVRERLHYLIPTFPEDTRKPQIVKYDPNASPVLAISLFGTIDEVAMREVAEHILQRNLSRVPGVGKIEVIGGRHLEILIEPNLEQLRSAGLSISELTTILKQNNRNLSLGSLSQGQISLPLRSAGEFHSLDDIKKLGVRRTESGSIIQLGQLAQVSFISQPDVALSRYQGEPRVMLNVYREYGSHLVTVSSALRQELERLQKNLPYGFKMEIIYDQSSYIVEAIKRLRLAGIIGAVLAILVVFLFLRHPAATLAIVLAIPISLIATFGFMFLAGISLNLVSLAGLTLGIGMLVDNAIVVIENIYRLRQHRWPATAVAGRGTAEVMQALTAATLIHLAVFFPIFFMQKRIRLLYQDLFYAVSFSLLVSLAVAVVLVPVLADRFPGPALKVNWLISVKHWHRRLLLQVLRHSWLWTSFALLLLGFSLLFLPLVGFESGTRFDRGEFQVFLQTTPGTSQSVTDNLAKRAEQMVLNQPEVKDVSARIHDNYANLRVRLVPQSQRSRPTRHVLETLRPQLEALPFSLVSFSTEGSGQSEQQVSLEVLGPYQDRLISLALELRRRLQSIPFLKDVVIHLRNPVPEIEINVSHRQAAYLGLSAAQIAHGIRGAVTGPLANSLRESEKEMSIRTRLPEAEKDNYRLLSELTIPRWSPDRSRRVAVPIWPALKTRSQLGAMEIHRLDRQQALELTAEVQGLDLYRTMQLMQPVLASLTRPPGYELRFGQNLKELTENRREILSALILGLLLVYMIMAALFESFRAPLVILSAVPFAAVGVVAILLMVGYAINLAVYVGLLVLLGIVLNNAIVLVDHINQLRAQGLHLVRAVIQGTQDRLRPILITSGTAVLGLLPMALERQEGSQLWSPLAWTVIGGLASATLLTLFIIPAHYLLLMRSKKRLK